MPLVPVTDNPKITDTVLFTLNTTDSDGTAVNPYKVNQVTIFFIERTFIGMNGQKLTIPLPDSESVNYFNNADTVAVFGTPQFPAWLSSDTANAFLTKEDFDEEGNPQVGVFSLQWTPDLKQSREGDYVICWTWTPIAAGDSFSAAFSFILYGDTAHTTVIPSHFTKVGKYDTLLERYTPEMFKMALGNCDLTPDILERTNLAIGKGFTTLEDMANQIVDLVDANAVAESILPYLANFFSWRLKSLDSQLWRRQIKQAIPLYKRKGTLGGLREALDESGMELIDFIQLWQLVSPWTWQDGFVVSAEDLANEPPFFTLTKLAILDNPLDSANFELHLRLAGTDEYLPLSLDHVTFINVNGVTLMYWVGDNLSINPISLAVGDVVVVIYKVADPVDQTLEDFIRTLPLADDRDVIDVTYPKKNWNVRLVEETDPLFPLVCPDRHPFHDPVVFGKIRTEFPYSENIYNMDEYNGSTRDSTNPCDIDKDFLDSCSCCLSSKFNISLKIKNFTPDRLNEADDVIRDFVPFHAVPHQVSYIAVLEDFIISPLSMIEVLVAFRQTDNLVLTQFHFNRLIEEGSSYADELKRDMLASFSTILSTAGTGQNVAITMFSPGTQFDTLGIDDDVLGDNVLEILSGANAGQYQVVVNDGDRFVVDVIQGVPDTMTMPLDSSGFPFRLSNVMYEQNLASIYQDDLYVFSDSIVFVNLGATAGWDVVVTGGIFAGTYPVVDVLPDNTLILSGWPAPTDGSNLPYQLKNGAAVIATSTTGALAVTRRGRVEIDLVVEEIGISQGDYVLYSGTQYEISNTVRTTVDNVYIYGYTGGDVVGSANVSIYRRLLVSTGYLNFRGMTLTGSVPTVDNTLENNMFLDNYVILIGSTYYQITEINGSVMTLNGPMLSWGLTGTAVNYDIVQFIKTDPITTQDGTTFERLDRRSTEAIVVQTETMPTPFMLSMFNSDDNSWKDSVHNQENITVSVEYR